MGACGVGGTFKAFDWRQGIQMIQDTAEDEHGYDSYNGAENNVNFRYGGDKSNLTKAQLEKYISKSMDEMYKRQGEVIKIGTEGFVVYKTVFKDLDITKNIHWKYTEQSMFQLRDKSKPATLFRDYEMNYTCLASGSLAEMKEKAHKIMRENYYQQTLYIVTKTHKLYGVTCDRKKFKTTTRKTDATYLVAELDIYRYFGWAPE